MKNLFIATLICLALHLSLGWQVAVLGAVLGGFLQKSGGWKVGLGAMFMAWLLLIFFQYSSAPYQMGQMFHTMSQILGNLPFVAFPIFTLLLASVLGALGGLLGTQIQAKFNV